MNTFDEILAFHNHEGRAVAYLYEGEYIYSYEGTPVAWLSDGEFIYSYSGKYLGWVQDGWVRDMNGEGVFFTENATGGPAKPVRQARPARGARGPRPAKAAREPRPARPARTVSWTGLSDESFFAQR